MREIDAQALEPLKIGPPGSSHRGYSNDITLRKVDVRLPGKVNSDSHGARPVHLIITMIKWIRTIRLSMKKSLSVSFRLRLKDILGPVKSVKEKKKKKSQH